jgi:hypothetical protein
MDVRAGVLIVRVSISVDNEPGLAAMLKDGASVQLTADLRLERLRTLWTNVTLAEKSYASILRHNPLTREFMLYMPEESSAMTDRNLARLLAETWYKLDFPLIDIDTLRRQDPGHEYRISLFLTLRHTEIPPWLSNAFAFWFKDVVEPVTLTIPFSQ